MKDLKKAVDVLIIKAISMTKPDARQQINMWEISDVDYLLLDSGNGGTGEQFSYKLLQEIGNLKSHIFCRRLKSGKPGKCSSTAAEQSTLRTGFEQWYRDKWNKRFG